MPSSCAVKGCVSRWHRGTIKCFFVIPSDPIRRKNWLVSIQRDDLLPRIGVTKHHRVCSNHFVTGRRSDDPLHVDFVPSLFDDTVPCKKKRLDKDQSRHEPAASSVLKLSEKNIRNHLAADQQFAGPQRRNLCYQDAVGEHMLTKKNRQHLVQREYVDSHPRMTFIQSVQLTDVSSQLEQRDVSSDEVESKFRFQQPLLRRMNQVLLTAKPCLPSEHSSADTHLQSPSTRAMPALVGNVIRQIDGVKHSTFFLNDHSYTKQQEENRDSSRDNNSDIEMFESGSSVENLEVDLYRLNDSTVSTTKSLPEYIKEEPDWLNDRESIECLTEKIKEEVDFLNYSDSTESVTSSICNDLLDDGDSVLMASEIAFIRNESDAHDWACARNGQHSQQSASVSNQKKILIAVTSKLLQRSVVELSRLDVSNSQTFQMLKNECGQLENSLHKSRRQQPMCTKFSETVFTEYGRPSYRTVETNNHLVEDMKTHTDDNHCRFTCSAKFGRTNHLMKHNKSHTGEKTFACCLCDAKFAQNICLVQHVRTHTGEKPFACSLCDAKFVQNISLVQHVRTHTGGKPFACGLCDAKFAQNISLVQHVRTHTGEPFACTLCGAKFAKNISLVHHMRTHTGKKPFACTLCGAKFAQNISLVKHVRTHSGENPFACSLCAAKFAQNSSLVQHVRNHASEPFACSLCNAKFAQNISLVQHLITHAGEKPFACGSCAAKFAQNISLIQHVRTHPCEKPFACGLCDAKFAQNISLVQHVITHAGENPFACCLCDAKFAKNNSLIQHVRTHTNEKLFTCSLCDAKFTQNISLVQHVRNHTGEKPFACSLCDAKFSKDISLIHHMRTHTSKNL